MVEGDVLDVSGASGHPWTRRQGGPGPADDEGCAVAGERAARIDALELERIAADGWPGLHTELIDGWLLRAGAGWTGRANSALPLTDADGGLDHRMDRVARWYRAHELPPLIQVPLPAMAPLRDRVADRGWVERWGAVVLVGDVDAVLAQVDRRPELPPVTVHTEPDAAWLRAYHYRGGQLPDVAVDVLRAGASPRFLSVVEDDETVAICRTSASEGWVGLTAVEVAERHRRRGLATHLLVGALELARAGGATYAYLQTERSNAAALALYQRAGFAEHHHYSYHGPEPADP